MRRGLISLFILLSALVTANEAQAQSFRRQKQETDTVKVAFLNGILVRADLFGAYQMIQSDHGQWEVGVRVNIKDRYFPALEVGIGKADHEEPYVPELKHKTRAPYFKIGCDFPVLKNKHDIYKAFAGFRYAFTSYDYDRTVADPMDEDAEDRTPTYTSYEGLKGRHHWLEGVFGVDAKIWGPLHLGWDVRYRRRLARTIDPIGEPWYVPGYGTLKAAGFAANFNLTFGF